MSVGEMKNKVIIGILGIILGILLIIFPFTGEFILSILTGIGILVLGIYFLFLVNGYWKYSKLASIIYLILGILGILLGIGMIGNIVLFDFLFGFYLYLSGFILIVWGILGLISRNNTFGKLSSGLISVLGLIILLLGVFVVNNIVYVALIMGISLIIDGIVIAKSKPIELFENHD
jgi:uncharacterized membrane protein HdeD (DUF308 family)